MSSSKRIGFLDSGIGGITVLKKAIERLPNESYVFFSDSKNTPYGDKSDSEIIKRCTEIVSMLINERDCKAIVIACNTASAKAAKSLREKFAGTPIIAIEPAYKMVHDIKPKGNTLIMATKGTIKSEKFRRLYYSYYDHHTSIHSFIGLADIIEDGNKDKLKEYLNITLAPYKSKVQNVVLGCTHYPLAKKEIAEVLGDVNFFDGAIGVSRQLEHILNQYDIMNSSNETGEVEFIDSSLTEEKRKEKRERFYKILNS